MIEAALEVAALSDVGTARDHNEDACVTFRSGEGHALLAVADGVSLSEGGEVASSMAVEVLLRAYSEERPSLPPGERLYRAVQQANIEIHDRAMVVPELRGMATTLTALVVYQGDLTAVHVGDSRLYLVRGHAIVQLTKDHTVAAEKVRLGFLSKEKAKTHPDRSVLTRSVGRELIVSRDRIQKRLRQGDVLVACSDGLHGVLEDDEIRKGAAGLDAKTACKRLIDLANARGTPDNLTVAVARVLGAVPELVSKGGLRERLRRLFP